ncbi:MAG: hypothetical protein QF516_14915, partial [Pirellulaceae bacterium]|nr:hypothetical protein [Pirellulaceae bacterium]
MRRLSQTGDTRFNATTGFHPVRVVGENTKQLGSGPFLGNGTRNGWADQTSIVIWTRTTREPEMRADGRPFIKIDNQRARQLARVTDETKLLKPQLPEGATLDEMLGACPGAPGEVRL